jgi:SNF2 family DNA or RNA helicase
VIPHLPHQPSGTVFLAARKRALLADVMGLAKSRQAIEALDLIGARTVTWIGPAVTRRHIAREFERWSPGRLVQVIETGATPVVGDVAVVSYELAVSHQIWRQLMHRDTDVLVLDEAQMLRTRTTKRTVGIYGRGCAGADCLLERASRCWLLSGSICPNHLGEFWPHYRAIFDGPLGYWPFLERYTVLVSTPFGPKPIRNRNVPEFRSLITPHVLRRRADQVIGLPELRTAVVALDPGTADLGALEAEPGTALLREALGNDAAVLALLEQASGGALARLRRLVGTAKIGPAIALLHDELFGDPEHRLVLFAWHVDVVRGLHAGLAEFSSRIIEGATPPHARQQAIDDFQARRARVICLQIVAGGVGIDLASADHCVLVEASWSPAENGQALARIARPSQRKPTVFARYLALVGSIDESVMRVLERKARALAEIKEIAA